MASEDLRILIEKGDVIGVDDFIKKGGDVKGIYWNKDSPLGVAIDHSDMTALVHFDVVREDEPISCHDEIIRLLINAGVDVNIDIENRHSPLLFALDRRVHCKVIYDLINAGADVNKVGRHHQSPLMYAMKENYNRSVISYLIQKGADVNHRSTSGETPLQFAFSHYESIEITSLLLNEGAYIFNDSGSNMHIFINNLSGHCRETCTKRQLVDLLVEKGMDLKAIDSWGRSILHYTCCHYLIYLCLKFGVSINCKDNYGSTPLMNCVEDHHIYKSKDLLFRFGADPNCGDNLYTPLHEVVRNGIDEICELLLYCGADLFAKDDENQTPLDYVNTEKVDVFNVADYHLLYGDSIMYNEQKHQRFGIIKHILLFYSEICLNDQFIDYSHDDQEILNKFIGDCGDELTKMKNTLLTNDLSFYEFCKLKRFYKSKVINISKDEYKFTRDEINELFPLYDYIINLRFEDNREKKWKRDLVCKFQNIIIRPQVADENEFNEVTLLYDCMYYVATHLDRSELYNVFLASVD